MVVEVTATSGVNGGVAVFGCKSAIFSDVVSDALVVADEATLRALMALKLSVGPLLNGGDTLAFSPASEIMVSRLGSMAALLFFAKFESSVTPGAAATVVDSPTAAAAAPLPGVDTEGSLTARRLEEMR